MMIDNNFRIQLILVRRGEFILKPMIDVIGFIVPYVCIITKIVILYGL